MGPPERPLTQPQKRCGRRNPGSFDSLPSKRRQGLAQDDRGLQRHLRRLRLSLSIGRLERPVDEKDAPPPVWAYRRFPHRSQPPCASSFDPPPTPIRRILLPRASCPVLPALR